MKISQTISYKILLLSFRLAIAFNFIAVSGCKTDSEKFIKFNSVDQLEIGDFVYLLDSNIGRVSKIELINSTPVVAVELSTSHKFCKSDSIKIIPVGLMGERKISIEPSQKCLEFYANDTLIGLNQIESNHDVKVAANLLRDIKATHDSLNSLPDTKSIPNEIRNFLARSKDCNHWAGEDGYDAERRAEIEKAMAELHCLSLDSDKIILINRFHRSPQLIELINSADTLAW